MNDEDLLIILAIAAIAVVGIVYGLASSIKNLLVSIGIGPEIAGEFGSLLFFLILLGLVGLAVKRA